MSSALLPGTICNIQIFKKNPGYAGVFYILRQKKQIRTSGAGNAGTDAESRYAGLYNNEDGSGDNALQKRKVSSTDMVEIRQKNVVHS